MKAYLLWFLALPALMLGLTPSFGWAQQPKEPSKEEPVLQKRAEAFVEAFNKNDAKLLAAFFTPDGDIVDTEGDHLKGRKEIEDSYQKLFTEAKGAKLFIRITSLRVINPDLALEDGTTEVVLPGAPPSAARYTVVWVKQDEEWYLASVREAIAVPPSNSKYLQDLGFLIGNWIEDAEKGGSTRASYSWAEQGNFIINTFELNVNGFDLGGGIQWIGWDAAAKKARAWTFVFNGGFAEGIWSKDGDAWKVAVTATMANGSKATARNIFKKVDADHFSFQLVERTLDGKPLPDEKVVKMKRVK
jgi:uncharacterized protein (TIGR02246 family)